MTTGALFTIGYEGRTQDEYLGLLRDAGVTLLADVRRNPISRKKGFSKRLLQAALSLRGIAYQHEPRLGNPRHNRPSFLSGNFEHGRTQFIQLMGEAGETAIGQLAELAEASTVAILCVERDSERCHRAAVTGFMSAARPHIRVVALP